MFSLKAARRLAQIVEKEKYTIISVHLVHAEIISALSKIFFNTSTKLVVTKHGYLQQFMDRHGFDYTKINKLSFSYQVVKLTQRFVHDNFAVSKGVADFHVHAGICKPSKIEVIYHGMEADDCKKVDSPVRYSSNQLLIAARLQKFKGHHFLVEAVKILCREIPDLKLVILGKGEEMENLVQMINAYDLNKWIIFEGYTDNVYNYINGSDVVVATSLAEPFGLTVLEAYSCEKPVIAFNVTAFNENIIDNKTGCLATPYDVPDLAEKIKYLLQNKDVAAQFGINGKKLLKEKFSLAECVTKTIAFFNKQ